MQNSNLKIMLDKLYSHFNDKKYIYNDPVEFPHRYKNEEDIVLIGFISALYSYGRVSLFKNVLKKIFFHLGDKPSIYLRDIDDKTIIKIASDGKYRFYKNSDIEILLKLFKNILKKENLIDFFASPFNSDAIVSGISLLRRKIIFNISEITKTKISDGINFMFPDPKSGGPLKRIFMFLRWMVRRDEIDFGIFKNIKKSDLIIPLDTHTAHIGRLLGMTDRKSNNLKCAMEMTDFLKIINPEDPVRYDFAIAHIGISKGCKHFFVESICRDCILKGFCNN